MRRSVILPLVVLVFLLVPVSDGAAQSKRQPGGGSASGSVFPVAGLSANEMWCAINYTGYVCAEIFETPYNTGGTWPAGTRNTHMFGSGLKVAGIVPRAATCTDATRLVSVTPSCFRWSGDTAGANFYDTSGREHGSSVAGIYNSRDTADVASWPAAGSIEDFPSLSAFVTDTSVFAASLIGRKAVSDQDTWTAYWDGDPARLSGRVHPLGILVEQRTLAWNAPSGNEATIYVVLRITNVTNNAQFQQRNEERFFNSADSLPNAGWRLDSLYATWEADPDVQTPSDDYITPILPFDMMVAYNATFRDPDISYPQSHFHAPFFTNATSMVGMHFLKTPNQRGMTGYSGLTGGGAFPTPNSIQRAWRYASFNLDPSKGDAYCMFPLSEARARRFCYASQTQSDAKSFMTTGPFSLEPGQSETIIIAITAAATVATASITPGSDNKPQFAADTPGCGAVAVRPIEAAAGWIETRACPSAGDVDPDHVGVVPQSLLGKAVVARALVERKFLMPAAPVAPPFALIPGRNQVTIVWDPSATESEGDPFAGVATDPASPLYDPNFRTHDVEGYRIWRGTSPDELELVAQFDREGTTFTDRACMTDPGHVVGTPCTDTFTIPIDGQPFSGQFGLGPIQYRIITTDANGAPRIERADTALAAQIRAGTAQPMLDTGIPYAWVDRDVRDGFQYFYRVTAFDINSIRSGPSSSESGSQVRSTTPRAVASSLKAAEYESGLFGRNRLLEPGAAPTLDPVTGTFSGPQPPTTQLSGEFNAWAEQLLATGTTEIRIDSIVPGYYANGPVATYHITADGEPATFTFTNNTVSRGFSPETFTLPVVRAAADPELRASLQAKGVDAPATAGTLTGTITLDRPHWHSAFSDWAYKQPGFWSQDPPNTSWAGGSRWFSGANESMPDPTADVTSHGRLDNVTRIFQPAPYQVLPNPPAEPRAVGTALSSYMGRSGDSFRRFLGTLFGLARAADVKLYWGAAGVDSVIDVTHNVPVPFSTAIRASYGFLTDADNDGVLTYGDFYYTKGLDTSTPNEVTGFAQQAVPLAPQPVLMPADVTGDLRSDGTGFGLYINGEPYLFQASRPAGTVWTLRTYNGTVARAANGEYSFTPAARNPAVPGLRIAAIVTAPATDVPASADLTRIHTVPDPYYAYSIWHRDAEHRELQFVNLPARATIRIYTLSGVLVDVVNHDDALSGGVEKWDLRGRGNHYISSGVYLFHVSTPEGREHVGRFTVVMGKTQ